MIYRQSGITAAEAMRLIRERYGDDVIVLSTQETQQGVEVLFSLDEPEQTTQQGPELATVAVLESPEPQPVAEHTDWSDWITAYPHRAQVWQDLFAQGVSSDVARAILNRLPEGQSLAQARGWTVRSLVQQIASQQAPRELVDDPGVYALVGPTGSGKTTSIAKIAARCLALHGKGSVAIITTDTYRIGAVDQLKIYGKVLGVNVHVAASDEALTQAIQRSSDASIVLVDTMGLSPRDLRTKTFIESFDAHKVRKLLVLNAASQAQVQADVTERFMGTGLYGSIVCKLDECHQLGGSLDVVLRHQLPVCYVSVGQRVPEDLHLADPLFLVRQALLPMVRQTFDLSAFEAHWEQLGLLQNEQPMQIDPSEMTF